MSLCIQLCVKLSTLPSPCYNSFECMYHLLIDIHRCMDKHIHSICFKCYTHWRFTEVHNARKPTHTYTGWFRQTGLMLGQSVATIVGNILWMPIYGVICQDLNYKFPKSGGKKITCGIAVNRWAFPSLLLNTVCDKHLHQSVGGSCGWAVPNLRN